MKDEDKSKFVPIYLKDIHSYYSFLDWLSKNFDEKIEDRSDKATLMLILIKKIGDDALKQLSFEEKTEFKKALDKLSKRVRGHYEKDGE